MSENKGNISDGYHTFNELYEHRHLLFRAVTKAYSSTAWRAKKHDDGSSFKGWFIAGVVNLKGKDITYHLPIRLWKEFAHCSTLEKAPKWDGHTSKDVIKRLKNL